MPRPISLSGSFRFWSLGLIAAIALAAAPSAKGDSIALTSNPGASAEGLGSFEGQLTFNAINDQKASLIIQLTNTTDPSIGGYLTRFVFNNPLDSITGLTLTSAPQHFSATLGNNSLGLEPFGQFDIEVGIGNGRPQRGLAAGQAGTFEFNLVGSGFNALESGSFFQSFSGPPGIGQGPQAFVVRFQTINSGAGDGKVPAFVSIPGDDHGGAVVVPEPASILSLAIGLTGIGLIARKLRRSRQSDQAAPGSA